MAGFTFSWGSSGDISIIGKHTMRLSEDEFTFSCLFEGSPATYSGTAGAHDAQFATGLATAHGYIGKNKAFTFKKGSSTLHTFSPTTNTGFLSSAIAENADHPANTGRFQLRRFVFSCQKPADQDSRAGRRDATISISRKHDGLRAVRLSGTWTALTTPLAALASYDASIASWAASWLGTGNVLAPNTDCFWVKTSETPVTVEEQNKVLTFERFYEERKYASNPSDSSPSSGIADPSGNVLSAQFFEMPIAKIGAPPSLFFSNGSMALNYGPKWEPMGGVGISPAVSGAYTDGPSRYGFSIDVLVKQSYGNASAWFTAVGLPWVRATLSALWPRTAGAVFESATLTAHDGNERRAVVSGVLLVPNTAGAIAYTETVELFEPRTRRFAPILNGIPHSYDISGAPPIHTARQTAVVMSLGGSPTPPAYLGRPWAFVEGSEGHSAEKIGWFQQATETGKIVYAHTFSRDYLRVENVGGTVDFPKFNVFGAVART